MYDGKENVEPGLFYYVYLLQNEQRPEKYYVGFTHDLCERLKRHNNGLVTYTSKYLPWRLVTYIAFSNEKKAIEFEKYLKTHSGRAFSGKHL